MWKTIEAIIDETGQVRLLEAVRLQGSARALVTILEPDAVALDDEHPSTEALSERALAVDWERPEEDAAWEHLQPAQ